VQLDAALPGLALCLTRGIAARLSARLLKQFGSPENVDVIGGRATGRTVCWDNIHNINDIA
jgi:hypothetical protein